MFGMQMQAMAHRYGKPMVFALNMIDEMTRFGHQIDMDELSRDLGAPVFAISAKTLQGIAEFKTAVLVDRNHKRYPVKTDFKGISLSTSLLEKVSVVFDEKESLAYLN